MRTRFLDSLTNAEVARFLERSDILFLPVGTVEMHGEMPLGCEHVLPLAFAVRMAERVDGLVLPHLAYFYAGATGIGEGTVMVSPSVGAAYLKEVCLSLLRHGFRRQILLTAHGPGFLTATLVVREFFEETHCPIAYIDLDRQFQRLNAQQPGTVDFNQMIWGAYYLLGRLDEIPLDQQPSSRAAYPEALAKLQRAGVVTGYYYSDTSQHGWWPPHPLTAAERLARAEEGVRQIERVLDALDPKAIVENLKTLAQYLETDVFPKFGSRLP